MKSSRLISIDWSRCGSRSYRGSNTPYSQSLFITCSNNQWGNKVQGRSKDRDRDRAAESTCADSICLSVYMEEVDLITESENQIWNNSSYVMGKLCAEEESPLY